MILHANFMHLALNMALFLAYGTAVARRMGPVAFLTLYATTGVWSAIFWCWLQPGSPAPLIGASGAVSGMVGAIAFLSFRPPSLDRGPLPFRSEEHTSELQSLMRISYAVFCLKKKNNTTALH